MIDAVMRRWLKVMDATALTARETLQRALGYGRAVEDVARSEIMAFRWQESVDAAAVLSRLARDTNFLVNPNKHHHEIRLGEARLSPRGNVWVLVSTPGVGAGMAETLGRHRLIEGEIPAVRRGELWELSLDVPEGDRRRVTEEIAVTRERKKGLLANPHVEDVVVFLEPPEAREIVSSLEFEEQTV